MKKKTLYILLGSAILLFTLLVYAQHEPELMSPADTQKAIQGDTSIVLLDVRMPSEFNGSTGHLANAILIPVQELEQRVHELQKYKQRPFIVYCRTGHRSTAGTDILLKHGYHARNMQGGITQWNAEQLPIVLETQPSH